MPLAQRAVEFTIAGDYEWTVPDTITLVRLLAVGAGGGGGGSRVASNALAAGGSGGGGGEIIINHPMIVVPGSVIQITIGAKGVGGTRANPLGAAATAGTGGTTTIVGRFRAAGGYGGASGAGGGDGRGGDGGGPRGGLQPVGTLEPTASHGSAGRMDGTWSANGGPSGAGYWHAGSHGGVVSATMGGPAPGTGETPGGPALGTTSPGGSGSSGLFGFGGEGGPGDTLGVTAPNSYYDGKPAPAGSWGAGGGGGGTDPTNVGSSGTPYYTASQGDGAAGEDGYVMIMWMEIED